jgi:hypothetical protein
MQWGRNELLPAHKGNESQAKKAELLYQMVEKTQSSETIELLFKNGR